MPHDDPRRFPPLDRAPDSAARLYAIAQSSLGAATSRDADACDAELASALDALLRPGLGAALATLFDAAPSAAVYRHLWRILARRERAGMPDAAQVVRLFAMPIVVVAGVEQPETRESLLPGVLDDVPALAAILKQHRALGGNETLSLANVVVAAEALDFARLPELLAWREDGGGHPLSPAPISVSSGTEGVHLRFLVGTALAASTANLFREEDVRGFGVPFAQALSRSLTVPGVSVLALPRAPQPLVEAVWQGRTAQREVAAQIFASNAIRRIRAATGEPSAVISVHETDGDERGGEVRLSLSSPFDPRGAEGLRCKLWPLDRVDDVVEMLAGLLADCRVTHVQRKPGVHPDRDAVTGGPLLFKPEPAPGVALH